MITAEETTFKPQRKLGMTDEFSRENWKEKVCPQVKNTFPSILNFVCDVNFNILLEEKWIFYVTRAQIEHTHLYRWEV